MTLTKWQEAIFQDQLNILWQSPGLRTVLYKGGESMDNPNNIKACSINNIDSIRNDAMNIPTLQLLEEDGSVCKGAVLPDINKKTALRIYKTMQFIRLLDERMQSAQRQGRISFYMQCTGEEAAITASTAALDDQDMIMAQYREQAALHYRGFSLDQFMNQMFSNEKDVGKGRQMPVHYGKASLNYMTISSPLATQIPQASGYAYGQKLRNLKQCTICYFGEGAASEGDFHAGLNMAAVHQSPVIFFCRNNGYAISTLAKEQFVGDGIAARGIGYGIKTIRVDGQDTMAVYAATQRAREIAITEQRPVLIEALTYRLAAHSTSDDPTGYRTEEEEEIFRQKNPILRFRRWLIKKKWLSNKADQALEEQLKQEILEAVKRAEKINIPSIDNIITDVYATPTCQLSQQLEALKLHINKYPDAYPKTAKEGE